jgi:hypothetical protein
MEDTKLRIAETLVANWNGVKNRTGSIHLHVTRYLRFYILHWSPGTDNHINCTA